MYLYSTLLPTEGLEALVAAIEPAVRRRLSDCLAQLRIPHSVLDRAPTATPTLRKTVYCLCSRWVLETKSVPMPAVIVCVGVLIPDSLMLRIKESGASLIALRHLTPATLFRAMAETSHAATATLLRRYLVGHPAFRNVHGALIDAFVQEPGRMKRLANICRVLQVSRAHARKMLVSSGFRRAEHLWTAMRAEAWCWFASQGLKRSLFEKQLGITDRRTFRRACRRASVAIPWAGRCLDAAG